MRSYLLFLLPRLLNNHALMFGVVLGLTNLADWQIIYYVYGRITKICDIPKCSS